jgi:hypothetical protein
MSVCEALHGRRPWLELELSWEPIGSSPEREGGGRGRERGVAGVGRHGEGEDYRRGRHGGSPYCSGLLRSVCVVRENRKQEGEEEKEERQKKKKMKENKRKKKIEKIQT